MGIPERVSARAATRCSMTFYRYIRLHEAGSFTQGRHGLFCTVWACGFKLYPLGPVHGRWSALGEFVCCRGQA
jgi:hypothetical protein